MWIQHSLQSLGNLVECVRPKLLIDKISETYPHTTIVTFLWVYGIWVNLQISIFCLTEMIYGIPVRTSTIHVDDCTYWPLIFCNLQCAMFLLFFFHFLLMQSLLFYPIADPLHWHLLHGHPTSKSWPYTRHWTCDWNFVKTIIKDQGQHTKVYQNKVLVISKCSAQSLFNALAAFK